MLPTDSKKTRLDTNLLILDCLLAEPERAREYGEIVAFCRNRKVSRYAKRDKPIKAVTVDKHLRELVRKGVIERPRHGLYRLPQRKTGGVPRWQSFEYYKQLDKKLNLLSHDLTKYPNIAKLTEFTKDRKLQRERIKIFAYGYKKRMERYLTWLKTEKRKKSLREEILLRRCDDALSSLAELSADLREHRIERYNIMNRLISITKEEDRLRAKATFFVRPMMALGFLFELLECQLPKPQKYHLVQTCVFVRNELRATIDVEFPGRKEQFFTYLSEFEKSPAVQNEIKVFEKELRVFRRTGSRKH